MNQHADAFLELYNGGLTQQQIADKFNLSRSRVKDILKQHPDYRPITRAQRLEKRNRAIREARQNTDMTYAEIGKAFGVHRNTVINVCRNVQ